MRIIARKLEFLSNWLIAQTARIGFVLSPAFLRLECGAIGTEVLVGIDHRCCRAMARKVRTSLIDRRNRSRDGTLVLQSEYLEVVIELKR